MLALAKTAPEPGVDLVEVDRESTPKGHLLIDVAAAAICGGDLKIYRWNQEKMKHWNRLKTFSFPRVLGHEISGTVVEVGADVSGFMPGDRVAIESHTSCGNCTYCRSARPHLCENDLLVGIGMDGGFAEFTVLPAQVAIPLPAEISWEQGALLEPLGVSLHAIEVSGVTIGDKVAVLGCGPIGLYCAMLARAAGASKIIMFDIVENRVELARGLGFKGYMLRTTDSSILDEMSAELDQYGAQIVFDAAGSPESVQLAVNLVATSGKIVLIGTFRGATAIDTSTHLVHREILITGISGRFLFHTWDRLIDIVRSGLVDPVDVVTHRFPLADGADAFKLADQGQAGKILLTP